MQHSASVMLYVVAIIGIKRLRVPFAFGIRSTQLFEHDIAQWCHIVLNGQLILVVIK